MNRFAKSFILSSFFFLAILLTNPNLTRANLGEGFYSTSGSEIIDSQGNVVRIAGVNLNGPVSGPLVSNGFEDKLDQIKKSGFDTVRLLFATESLDSANRTRALQSFDRAVNHATKIGLKIILDRHRMHFGNGTETALWYGSYSEQRWIDDWQFLARKYQGNSTIIGADLHNEPHTPACWGCSQTQYDWRLAAEKAGNAILETNPDWLIIVEGVNETTQGWSRDLTKAGSNPVKLNVPNKLVYEAHEYGSNLASNATPPTYFNSKNFPSDLPARWDKQWGYLTKSGTAPILIGEFGTGLQGSKEVKWFDKFIDYVNVNNISWTYFAWHRYDFDNKTGTGLLLKDWTPRPEVQSRLQTVMKVYNRGTPPPPPPPPNSKPGDANNDNQVDNSDLAIFTTNFGKTGGVEIGNFNSDAIVDGLDYAIWFANYGK